MASLADVARQVQARRRHEQPAQRLPTLILMTDAERLPDPEPAVARLPRGAAVILRHYGAPNRVLLAHRLAQICRRRGLLLLVADDARLAVRVGAHGLHLPEFRVRTGRRRWTAWCRRDWLVTAAAHSPRALYLAARIGANAAILSPVFSTASHPDGATIGARRFGLWVRRAPLPVYALGGLNPGRAMRLCHATVVGFAGISGLVPYGQTQVR